MIYANIYIFRNSALCVAYIEGKYQLAIITMIYVYHVFFWNSALCTAYIEGKKKKAWPMFACRQRITGKPKHSFLCLFGSEDRSDPGLDFDRSWLPSLLFLFTSLSVRRLRRLGSWFDSPVFSSRGTIVTWACSTTRLGQVRARLLCLHMYY